MVNIRLDSLTLIQLCNCELDVKQCKTRFTCITYRYMFSSRLQNKFLGTCISWLQNVLIKYLYYRWVAKLFYTRSKRKLNLDDLFKPSKFDESAKLGSTLEKYWEEELIRAEAKREQPNLMKALNRMFLGKLICCGILVLLFSLLA